MDLDRGDQPLISFIILSWNSSHYLARCLDSIASRCGEEEILFETIVVDNGSSDGSVELLSGFAKRSPENFRVIPLSFNSGTTYSRNLGLRQARGEYLCILDSDTEFGEGSLRGALHELRNRPGVGVLAPRLMLPDGSVQHSVKRFPTLLHKLAKLPRILFGVRGRNRDFYPDFPFEGTREVDTAISACWLFRRALLDRVGFLDEKIFYAPEDLDFCLRVWRAGLIILYWPALTVLHHTQQITHRSPFSRTSLSHLAGLWYYYRKHGGWLFPPQARS